VIELNDSVIASASYDHTIKLWNRDGTCLATFKGHTSQVCAVIELKDGNLASSSYDGTIKIWGRDGSCLATLKENTGSFMSLIELNDGTLASASGSKVQLWTFPLIN
jgi:WD40 repeat protein